MKKLMIIAVLFFCGCAAQLGLAPEDKCTPFGLENWAQFEGKGKNCFQQYVKVRAEATKCPNYTDLAAKIQKNVAGPADHICLTGKDDGKYFEVLCYDRVSHGGHKVL